MRFTHWPGTARFHRASGGFADFLLDRNLKIRRFNYLSQCGLAAVSLMVILVVEDVVFSGAIVAAVALSAFTVLVFPNGLASTPRKVVGSHAVALDAGAIVTAILALPIIAGAEQDFSHVWTASSVHNSHLGGQCRAIVGGATFAVPRPATPESDHRANPLIWRGDRF